MSKSKNKSKKKNTGFVLSVLVITILTIAAFVVNIILVSSKQNSASKSTLEIDRNSSISNDQYVIGNNPTALLRENFKELTAMLKENDPYKISEYVVKCFIIDHFTWSNKDGNYEVGGLQYVYGPKFTSFSQENRYNFYKDLDLYIEKYGRENLLEVESITTTAAVDAVEYMIGDQKYKSYYIEATWKYRKSDKIDVNSFQKTGYFTVINNNGRYEIVSMYDSWD